MFDGIYTRKNGYAFGLDRSGYKVKTMAKDRYHQKESVVKRPLMSTYVHFTYKNKNNPLLYKTPRHG